MRNLMIACAALAAMIPASAAVRVRGGFIAGPAFYRPYWYGGYWGDPFYRPYAFPVANPNAGELKLETPVKDADVFIDGAYAGQSGKLKSMWLRAGAYNIEVRSPGRTKYAERVYVVAGKTLHLRPDLRVDARP